MKNIIFKELQNLILIIQKYKKRYKKPNNEFEKRKKKKFINQIFKIFIN